MLKHTTPESDNFVNRSLGTLCVWSVLFAILLQIRPGLFVAWWFNTDELVFYYEVVRQLRLNFAQTFFDIPGTPFMGLTSFLTTIWWGFSRLVGATDMTSPADFAFEHIQGVYTLMRGITMVSYILSVLLTYSVIRRVTNTLTGVLAAFLMATLPVYVQYSHFVRTESLGLVLCLAAIWLMIHPKFKGKWSTYLIAGILAGIAMATRFHFAMVGLPVMLSIYFLQDRPDLSFDDPKIPRRWLWGGGIAILVLFTIGSLISLLYRAGIMDAGIVTHTMLLTSPGGPELYAGAKQTLAKLWILLGVLSITIGLLLAIRPSRKLLRPIVNVFTLSLALGFAFGFLATHPTFLWQGEYQLRSVQFYSDWTDPELEALGPLQSWWNVTLYYFNNALPEIWLQILFLVGVVVVLIRRKPLEISFFIGTFICFIAHPVTMKLWPHHIIPWLPFFCFLAALPVGLLFTWATGFLPASYQQIARGASLLIVTGLCVWLTLPRFAAADDYLVTSQARTVQIGEMSEWIDANVPKDAFLALSYYTLNDEGFLKWIEGVGVAVPEFARRYPELMIWWLDKKPLEGKKGWLAISRADIEFFRADKERLLPGSTFNPFEDPGFKELATFGAEFYEIKVFSFDFTQPQAADDPTDS